MRSTPATRRKKNHDGAFSGGYPDAGVRLIRQQDRDAFNRRMHQFKAELEAAVLNLDRHYAELRGVAQRRLGSLYNPGDYPASLRGLFDVDWDFPSVEPPDYLMRLNPQLFEQERARMQARFDEAVHLAEQAFVSELGKLVEHLVERLTGTEDGQRKTFRDSAVTNLTEFFERFRALNVHPGREAAAGPRQRGSAAARGESVRGGAVKLGRDANRPAKAPCAAAAANGGGDMSDVIVLAGGIVRCLYDEHIELASLGQLRINRASYVEPDDGGQWWADLSPVRGPTFGPFTRRSQALAAEIDWLAIHRLGGCASAGADAAVAQR